MGRKLQAHKIVFLGAGNMAEALVHGIVRSRESTPDRILVTDLRPERLKFFLEGFGVKGSADNARAVHGASLVVLAVKPQILPAVLDEIRGSLSKSAVVLSIAAGVRTATIEAGLGDGVRVVRAMPNTPALVKAGAAAVCGGKWATEDDVNLGELVLASVGQVVRVPEDLMDAVTAVSGSGPAYVFTLVESMLEAAARLGLQEDIAKELVYATVSGSAKLIAETGMDAAELRARVTSKGGTTEAAVKVLGEKGVPQSIVEAILAAHARAAELSGG